jgi:hypothetical protein
MTEVQFSLGFMKPSPVWRFGALSATRNVVMTRIDRPSSTTFK